MVFEDFCRLPDGVSCRYEHVAIMIRNGIMGIVHAQCEPFYELMYNTWRPPTVHRKAEPDTFVGVKHVMTVAHKGIGDEYSLFVRGFGKAFGYPTRISCS